MKKTDVTICMITLGRESIYKTLESILSQDTDYIYDVTIILQGELSLDRINQLNTKKIKIKIFNYEKNLGFGYYRNEAIKNSEGDILLWIDDDEYTKNNSWISNIIQPINEKGYKVVTAGTDIKLGQGYISDCISYLGYPGGGAVGFTKMWKVSKRSETNHLCSGNFAFHKDILNDSVSFDESLKSGAEDNAFARRLIDKGIIIYYKKEATIYHEARDGIINFCKWHIKRGKSAYEIKKLGLLGKSDARNKLNTLKYILFDKIFTRYIFGIWLMFLLQVICNLYGYFIKSFIGK